MLSEKLKVVAMPSMEEAAHTRDRAYECNGNRAIPAVEKAIRHFMLRAFKDIFTGSLFGAMSFLLVNEFNTKSRKRIGEAESMTVQCSRVNLAKWSH